jgi:hypothetical protein
MDDQSRCVFIADGEIQAQQVSAFLKASGISSALRGESLRKTHGFTIDGLGAVAIFVPVNDEEHRLRLWSFGWNTRAITPITHPGKFAACPSISRLRKRRGRPPRRKR